jgi:hypothetical protein
LFFCLPPPFPLHPQHRLPSNAYGCCAWDWIVFPFFYPCHSGLFECIANIICALKCILKMSSLPQPYKYHVWWVCIPNNWVLYRHKKAFVCFLTYASQYFGCTLNPIIMLLVTDSYLLCTSTSGEERASST